MAEWTFNPFDFYEKHENALPCMPWWIILEGSRYNRVDGIIVERQFSPAGWHVFSVVESWEENLSPNVIGSMENVDALRRVDGAYPMPRPDTRVGQTWARESGVFEMVTRVDHVGDAYSPPGVLVSGPFAPWVPPDWSVPCPPK